jgi:hypothetical protein
VAAGEREREREREKGRGGGRERNNPWSKPLDKHNTQINRHYKQEVLTEVCVYY